MKSIVINNLGRGSTKFQQKFGKVQDTGMDGVKMDVSMGIWTYPRGKNGRTGDFKGGHFVRDAEVAGSNPVAPSRLERVRNFDFKGF